MRKILVIDDDMGIRMLLSEELMEDGYDVFASDQAGELSSLIDGKKPDLVVMEMGPMTPGNLDRILEIRNRFEGLPVILWTAYPFFNAKAKSVGPDFCLTKSSDLSELKSRICAALEGHAEQRDAGRGVVCPMDVPAAQGCLASSL